MVVLLPLPVTLPGLIVQLPDGRPLSTTLPVAVEQPGCVTVPVMGAEGVTGWAVITILDDTAEVQPTELVTV